MKPSRSLLQVLPKTKEVPQRPQAALVLQLPSPHCVLERIRILEQHAQSHQRRAVHLLLAEPLRVVSQVDALEPLGHRVHVERV